MNAEFFALAFTAALNPKLLAYTAVILGAYLAVSGVVHLS